MEFTNNQMQQLQQLKDMAGLTNQLQAKSENVKKMFETLITDRSTNLSELKMLKEHIESLQEEVKQAKETVYCNQIKLEELNKSCLYDNNEYLQSIFVLLGFKISKFQLLENNGVQITLRYRDICYVTYSETSQVFDLIEVYPQHYNFPQIKEFLHHSQDFRGLLSCLRKYFDFALECKDNQELIDMEE